MWRRQQALGSRCMPAWGWRSATRGMQVGEECIAGGPRCSVRLRSQHCRAPPGMALPSRSFICKQAASGRTKRERLQRQARRHHSRWLVEDASWLTRERGQKVQDTISFGSSTAAAGGLPQPAVSGVLQLHVSCANQADAGQTVDTHAEEEEPGLSCAGAGISGDMHDVPLELSSSTFLPQLSR